MSVFDPSPAEEGASPAATDINSLDLTFLRDGVATPIDFPIEQATMSGRIRRTVEGASELTLQIHDPDWTLLDSGLFDTELTGGFTAKVEIRVGPLFFRLVKVSPSAEQVTLVFEDREVALLRNRTQKVVMDRKDATMAQFASRLIRSTHDGLGRLRAWIPELHDKQAISATTAAAASTATTSNARREKGLPAGLTYTFYDGEKVTLNKGQTANAERVLATAAAVGAGPKATLALLEACIVEGPNFNNPTGGTGTSVGILQATDDHFGGSTATKGGRRDIELVCKKFLRDGFTGPGTGAIVLAKAHPGWSPGEIAATAQGPAPQYRDRYGRVSEAAQKVLDAYNGGGGRPSASNDAKTTKPYRYRVTDNYWKTLTDYAQSVNWRCFVCNGVVYFVSEERLFESRARTTIRRDQVTDLAFDWDVRRQVAQVTFSCRADFWAAPPGSVVHLEDAGPASGRWLVTTTERGLHDPTTSITLSKPILKLPEEADSASSSSSSSSSSSTSATGGFPRGSHLALMWAKMRAIDRAGTAYKYTGGHNAQFAGPQYDCSGAVSAVLHAGKLLDRPLATGDLLHWGEAGVGKHLTVWVMETGDPHTSHTFITVVTPNGKTHTFEAGGHDSSRTGFHTPYTDKSGFQPRHWKGL